jgi:hypothetical protein
LEQIDKNFLTILDTFQINPNLFINSTYENLKHGLIMTYNDAIFPEMDELAQSLSKFIGVDAGFQLYPDFSHISILQADEAKEAQTMKEKIANIVQLKTANIITPTQAAEIIDNITTLEIPELPNNISERLSLFSPLVITQVLQNMTPNERRALAGLGNIEGGDELPTPNSPTPF